jgi:sigma-B regulation protein RsbU (phosphoserine phosphatase)
MISLKTVYTPASGGILVVDDNDINRDICAINLEKLHLPLHFAENGAEGLALAKEVHPDLILLDIMMPVMDGFEMLRIIRQTERLDDIPVLMLTAKSETESIVKALELGANDYLKKPFAEEEMVARVQTLLKNRYLEKQVKQDIADGAAIQGKFLTDSSATTELFGDVSIDVGIFNKPYCTVSGDFFYTFKNQNNLYFFLGDSSGHGLSAALISMRILGLLQRLGTYPYSTAQLMKLLNKDICGLLPIDKFVAASCIAFTPELCTITNAAQPYPLLRSNGKWQEIVMDGFPIGINDTMSYGQKDFQFNAGDRLILFTDGILELSNQYEEMYGKERLYSSIKSTSNLKTCTEVANAVANDLKDFAKGAVFDDDLSLIVLEKH